MRRAPKESSLPLAGIRVTDFAWIGAGAYATKILADAGAEVVRIESRQRVDSLRLAAPYKDGILGVNRSGYFADRNTSKRSITLDMKHPKALALVERLIRKSDIIANNFTPGVMERFGLDYEAVRAMKPDIIYLTMSMSGGSGPERSYSGYGSGMASITGLQHLTAFPGREPAGTGTNYPDHVPNPCHATFAVLAALRHRRRTGEGQRIDIAQTEPTVALLGPTMLDYTVNGVVQQPPGNAHPQAAPHGAYPCQGEDRWIAIGVMHDDHWLSLREVLGNPSWMQDAAWTHAPQRHARRAQLDALLSAETRRHTAENLMQALQARAVPAGIVATAKDVVRHDPQLAHRGHWLTLDHPEMGKSLYNAPPYRFLDHPISITVPAPLIGQHTEEVCSQLLELSADQFKALADEGVFN
jgi:benzylsuccinate CoA-transferase BbsF subunit